MANRLEISVLGGLTLQVDGQPAKLPPGKSEALLVYLVCTGQPQPRELLAELLWQAESHGQARRNLTYALYRLRQALEAYIITTPQTIAFNQGADHWLDAATLAERVAAATQESTLSNKQSAKLAEALSLYQGDFLAGFHVPDATGFEAWVTDQREWYHRQAIEGLHRLVSHYAETADYTNGLEYAQRLLNLDEFDEMAHQQMMRLLALSGQRGAALSQFDILQQKLQEEFGVEPLAETRTLYEQIQQGDLSDIEPPPTRIALPDIPFQAPNPPAHFVGREVETAQLQVGLTQEAHPRIQALVGMGGVGKTTLAAYMAHHLRETFTDGVLWANVAISSPMDILATWASAYNHDYSSLSDLESRAAAVRNLLVDKRVLLIIDNVTGSKDIQALLPSGETCATLLTSRDLDAAHALQAEPLLLGELSPDNARQLLVYILGEARVTAEEAAAREICELLQHLPLAVEIGAQRLKSRVRQSLAQMAARLREMKNRLGLQVSDQAVRTSFEVSWEAMAAELQDIFPLLAVFEGRPFTADAIAYLADDADVFDIEDQLYALCALSLVTEDGDSHFRQHPLLADFAQTKLEESKLVYARMSDYYLTFAQDNQQNKKALRPEWQNLLAAIKVAYEQARWAMVLAYTDTLQPAWVANNRHTQARVAFEWATEAAQQVEDRHQEALNLLYWGQACSEQADFEEAKQHLKVALDYFRDLEQPAQVADALYYLARLSLDQGHFDEAHEALHESLPLRNHLGDIQGIATLLMLKTRIFYTQDEFADAKKVAEETLALQETLDDDFELIDILRLISQIVARLGEFDEAKLYGLRALQLSEALQNTYELAITHFTLTTIYKLEGDFQRALLHADQSLPLMERVGQQRGEGIVHYQIGLMQSSLQNHDLAITHFQESDSLFEMLSCHYERAMALISLGDAYDDSDKVEQADKAYQAAQTIAAAKNYTDILEALEALI